VLKQSRRPAIVIDPADKLEITPPEGGQDLP
jgi:hypothetical protein